MLQSIVADSQAAIALDQASEWQPPTLTPDSLAFLQYTSGSTGDPKGVVVSHDNILHNSDYIRQLSHLTSHSVSVSWLPSFHDMGLIDGILQPLYTGFLGILMPSVAFTQQPIRWLQAISRYRATHSGGPNFGYDLCVHKTTPTGFRLSKSARLVQYATPEVGGTSLPTSGGFRRCATETHQFGKVQDVIIAIHITAPVLHFLAVISTAIAIERLLRANRFW